MATPADVDLRVAMHPAQSLSTYTRTWFVSFSMDLSTSGGDALKYLANLLSLAHDASIGADMSLHLSFDENEMSPRSVAR